MTSDAKGNHSRITELLQASAFFGRSPDSFNLFCQPMVPVVSVEDGKWLLPEAFSPLLKPGGHGVIWKLMADNGVFDWMEAAGRKAALVRQISNPLAGTDTTLLALAGTGSKRNHAFGFASCERAVGAAEGMNVLIQETVESVNAAGERVEHSNTASPTLSTQSSNVLASLTRLPATAPPLACTPPTRTSYTWGCSRRWSSCEKGLSRVVVPFCLA